MKIATEANIDGEIVRIIVYTDDKKDAEIIANKMQEIIDFCSKSYDSQS